MFVKDRFTRNRIERVLLGRHAVSLASAIPKAIQAVEVAHVPHAMPETVAILYFAESIVLDPSNILACDNGTTDD